MTACSPYLRWSGSSNLDLSGSHLVQPLVVILIPVWLSNEHRKGENRLPPPQWLFLDLFTLRTLLALLVPPGLYKPCIIISLYCDVYLCTSRPIMRPRQVYPPTILTNHSCTEHR